MKATIKQPQEQALNVRQREYAIAQKGEVLISKNFYSCIGLIGTDKESGVAFLCHFDMPFGTRAIHELTRELIEHGIDPARFRLYTVRGFHWSLLVACVIGAIAGVWFESPAIVIALLLMLVAWMATPTFMYIQLLTCGKFKRKWPMPLKRHQFLQHGLGLLGYCHVTVIAGEETPQSRSTRKREDYELFKADRCWLDWDMKRANPTTI